MEQPNSEYGDHGSRVIRRRAEEIVRHRRLVAYYRQRGEEAPDPRERVHAGRLADDLAAATDDLEQTFRASFPAVDLDGVVGEIERAEPALEVRRRFAAPAP